MVNQILIGVGAGLTAALLYVSAASFSPLAILLFYLGPLPVFLATLGWGRSTGLVAGATAAVLITLGQSLAAGALFAVSVIVPSLVLCYLARLSRQNEAGDAEYYPVGRLVVWAGLISAVTSIGTTLALGIGAEEISTVVAHLIDQVIEQNPEFSQNRENLDVLAQLAGKIVVPVSSVVWSIALLFNLWLAGRILRKSERLDRPWPDLHQILLPRQVIIGFAAALLLSFMGGVIGSSAVVLASCLAMMFFMVGLSTIHFLLPPTPQRGLILSGFYFVLLFLAVPLSFLPLLAVVLLGLLEPFLQIRHRAAARRGPNPPSGPPSPPSPPAPPPD